MVVLCDFDATITTFDTAEFTLDKFAQGNWKAIDKLFEEGKITLEDCLKREFAMVHASRQQILEALGETMDFRPNFPDLIDYCRDNSVPLVIVSAGLDFVIANYLKIKHWARFVETYTARTRFTRKGIEFDFPVPFDKTTVNFKQDLVRQYKAKGTTIAYVGDGSGDFDAARESDFVFAIKDSKLAELCKKHDVRFVSILDFNEVVRTLRKIKPTARSR